MIAMSFRTFIKKVLVFILSKPPLYIRLEVGTQTTDITYKKYTISK